MDHQSGRPYGLHQYSQQSLPSPTALRLPLPTPYSQRHVLPPLSSAPSRYPPAAYHPSLSNASLPPLSASWHRGVDRDTMLPPPRRDSSLGRDRDLSRERDRRDSGVKRESSHSREPPERDQDRHEEGTNSTSDFVKKLFKMLEDPAIAHVVSWGPQGDCFVVKDMNEFTKSILPRMFKHSNFASFVRQLNKYDFHKVKNTDDNQFGEHSWTFRHPDFHANRPESLENIKRKVPTQRKSTGGGAKAPSGSPAPQSAEGEYGYSRTSQLEAEVDRLRAANDETTLRLRDLEARYESVLAEIVGFQRSMAQQDGLMKEMMQTLLRMDAAKLKAEAPAAPPPPPAQLTPEGNPFLGGQDAQRLVGAPYLDSGSMAQSLMQINNISREAESRGMSFAVPDMPGAGMMGADAVARIQQLQRQAQVAASTSAAGAAAGALGDGSEPFLMPSGAEQEGLQIFTVGSLLPRSTVDDANGNWTFDGSFPGEQQQEVEGEAGPSIVRPPSTLRVRRSTYVPGWAIPPKILLVDDDALICKLSSKFLQGFGVTMDVAVDGESAVAQMNLHKYDLVLMDIVMPKLDGVSATSLIRQFDHMTPIISMTSAAKPDEIMKYYSHGMNDILPKPFSKQGLIEMIEKHLMHLKVFQQMAGKIERPMGDAGRFEEVEGGAGAVEGAGKINPLAAFGMTDEQYSSMLHAMVSDEFGVQQAGKRALEMELGEEGGRDGKRGRFEEVA